jgi:hypothetical protein
MDDNQPRAHVAHLDEQDVALDRMVDSLSRLSTMAGHIERELGTQLVETEELEGSVHTHDRDHAELVRRGESTDASQRRIDLLCCSVCLGTLLFVFAYFFWKRRHVLNEHGGP